MKIIIAVFLIIIGNSIKAQETIVEKQITLDEIKLFNQDYCQSFIFTILKKIERGEIIAYRDSLFSEKINIELISQVKKDSFILFNLSYFDISNFILKNNYVKLLIQNRIVESLGIQEVYCYINSKDFFAEMKIKYFMKLFFENNNNLSFKNYELFTNKILDSIINKISNHVKTNVQFDSIFYPYYQKPEGIYFFYKKKFGKVHRIKIHEVSLFGNNNIRFFIIRRFDLKVLNEILNNEELRLLKFIFYESI